jgi:hypothetical protein
VDGKDREYKKFNRPDSYIFAPSWNNLPSPYYGETISIKNPNPKSRAPLRKYGALKIGFGGGDGFITNVANIDTVQGRNFFQPSSDPVTFDGLQLKTGPVLYCVSCNSQATKSNDRSIITMALINEKDRRQFVHLNQGDASPQTEDAAFKSAPPQIRVVKLSHHGAKGFTSVDLLKKYNPEVVIITAGLKNVEGHPYWRTVLDVGHCLEQSHRSPRIIPMSYMEKYWDSNDETNVVGQFDEYIKGEGKYYTEDKLKVSNDKLKTWEKEWNHKLKTWEMMSHDHEPKEKLKFIKGHVEDVFERFKWGSGDPRPGKNDIIFCKLRLPDKEDTEIVVRFYPE